MNKRLIAPLLALGIASGFGTGFIALAQDAAATQPAQTQVETTAGDAQNAPRHGGKHGGRDGMFGFGFGQAETTLTIEQQKELNLLRAEYLNTMLDFKEEQTAAAEALKAAITKGAKDDILSAWDAMTAVLAKVETALGPVEAKIQSITGTEADKLADRLTRGNMAERIEALKDASSEADIQSAIEALQSAGPENKGARQMEKGTRGVKPQGFDSENVETPTPADDSTTTDTDGTTSASPKK